jgi:hypothetical protein
MSDNIEKYKVFTKENIDAKERTIIDKVSLDIKKIQKNIDDTVEELNRKR